MQINAKDLPATNGLYAWYYRLHIGKNDIESLREEIEQLSLPSEKKTRIRAFVNKYLFNFFKEEDYDVFIDGQLKAKYQGKVSHQIDVSASIVDKIFEDFEILWEIRSTLKSMDYNFSSPLYIGMASNLAQRVNKHKSLIQRYRAEKGDVYEHDETADHNFAARIVCRNFIETNLIVVLSEVPSTGLGFCYSENIMNRISFPILGRN